MKKKLLVAGGSYGDIPIIKEAKKLGFYVITSGNREDDLGHKFSDEYHLRDFSNKEDILELAKSLNIDAIVPSCHDLSMVTCAYVAEKLCLAGYDSYETTLNLHHKDRFRKICDEIGLMVPKSYAFDNIEKTKESYSKFHNPCIVKPIDLGGGKGITIVNNIKNIDEAIDYAFESSKSKKIVIEEFVEGTLHSFSTFINNGKVIVYFGDNEFSSVNPYGVATSTSPSNNFNLVKNKLIKETEKLAEYLHLKDGLLHMQYLLNDDKINIIEFTRRMPGDWYSRVVELSTGVNHAYWTLQGYLNGDFSKLHNKKQNGYYSRHCIMALKNGYIKNLFIDNSIKENIVDSFILIDKYIKVDDYIYQKFGIVFLKYNSLVEMEEKTKKINELIKIEIKKD
ncbi:ATP-grasp domain-containing protein [Arcobacter lacus]|uniref:ATP-grasp domain-containing protein n=1 Tax=Arcobacter lacus TaxID=1912876 RepID=UPI0021BAD5DB|nr:ATP-grasp domain-containing protein [Arcobacter lacus]MCT7909646.1 ATP-grasp domain-containing protein [Arcobacter lacus]